jgi:hypothetical protein
MDSGHSSDIKVNAKTSKTEVQLCIIDIDSKLSELPITIAKIQDNFHRLLHFAEGLDVVKFASHEKGDK